jgi:hypothetical protein
MAAKMCSLASSGQCRLSIVKTCAHKRSLTPVRPNRSNPLITILFRACAAICAGAATFTLRLTAVMLVTEARDSR